ncbi:hypothetical protein GQ600_25494 [Phytophthora cactorum]|nr:hypothetical protein GQ600_25494 [Phytophthora cactorum]
MNVVVLSFMGNQVQVISPEATVPSNTAILQLRLSKKPTPKATRVVDGTKSLIMSFNVQTRASRVSRRGWKRRRESCGPTILPFASRCQLQRRLVL